MTNSSLIKTVTTAAVSAALLVSALLIHSCTDENGIDSAFLNQRKEGADYVTDSDGKKYRTVKVGNLTWLAENVNRKTHNSWCYDGADFNCEKYGRLYAWRDAKYSACPKGWHLPTDGEWKDLEEATGDDMWTLRSRSWGGKDKYGWSALPGGFRRAPAGSYSWLGSDGWWWSAYDTYAGSGDTARARLIEGDSSDQYFNTMQYQKVYKGFGVSVRCVADDKNAKRYTVSIDPDGGYGNDVSGIPQYVFDDMTVDAGTVGGSFLPLNLVKPGYRFKGWLPEGANDEGEYYLQVTKDVKVKAVWVLSLTVRLNRNDGTSSSASVTPDSGTTFRVALYSVDAGVRNPTRVGYHFEGWFDGETRYADETVLVKSVTLNAKWTAAEKYTVSFDTDGAGEYDAIQAYDGTVFGTIMPDAPTKPGYFFEGWFSVGGEERYTAQTVIRGDVELKARWREVPKYTVSFNTDGGTPATIASVQVDSGSTLAGKLPANPAKSGNYFGGWFNGATQYTAATVITGNVALTAKWSTAPKYTVSFNTDGGTPATIASVQADSGSGMGAQFPANPTKAGYLFLGWFDGTVQYTAATVITKGVTLKANWKQVPKYTVTFNANGGTLGGASSVTIDSGNGMGALYPANPTRSGYMFDGWLDATSTARYTAQTPITKSVSLTAQWREWPTYTVQFNTSGGTPSSIGSMAVDSGSTIGTRFPANPTKPDNIFVGWYVGAVKYTATTVIRGNVTIVAKFEEIVPNQFDTFYDERDGETYTTVKLGPQTWMAENLRYETGNSWCYGDDAGNCEKYGKLYDWATATKACPDGWHLATADEWTALAIAAGGTGTNGDGGTAAKKLKAASGWGSSASYNGTDDYGFSALPGGYRQNDSFGDVNNIGYWWTSAESGSYGINRSMYNSYTHVGYNNKDKSMGASVRCVQNN